MSTLAKEKSKPTRTKVFKVKMVIESDLEEEPRLDSKFASPDDDEDDFSEGKILFESDSDEDSEDDLPRIAKLSVNEAKEVEKEEDFITIFYSPKKAAKLKITETHDLLTKATKAIKVPEDGMDPTTTTSSLVAERLVVIVWEVATAPRTNQLSYNAMLQVANATGNPLGKTLAQSVRQGLHLIFTRFFGFRTINSLSAEYVRVSDLRNKLRLAANATESEVLQSLRDHIDFLIAYGLQRASDGPFKFAAIWLSAIINGGANILPLDPRNVSNPFCMFVAENVPAFNSHFWLDPPPPADGDGGDGNKKKKKETPKKPAVKSELKDDEEGEEILTEAAKVAEDEEA